MVKNILLGVVLTALTVTLSGCGLSSQYTNFENSAKLRVGMTKEQVLAVMGKPLDAVFSKPDVWFYYYDCNWLDGFVTEEECFPLVFTDGKLLGFGNNFYAKWQLENRDRMPNVELPPEAFAGDKKQ